MYNKCFTRIIGGKIVNKKEGSEIMETKERCFADIDEDTCYCLKEKCCKKESCKFYKSEEQARKDYFNTYSEKTIGDIDRNIDKYFRNL